MLEDPKFSISSHYLPVKKRTKPKANDKIEVQFVISQEITLSHENIPLNIIYEDNHIIAVNKPASLVVHPAPMHWSEAFVNALLHYCGPILPNSDSLRPSIVQRLDKDTTEVLIAAKTDTANKRLTELFSHRKVYKEYIAICIGNPGNREISEPRARNPINRKKTAMNQNGYKNWAHPSDTRTHEALEHPCTWRSCLWQYCRQQKI